MPAKFKPQPQVHPIPPLFDAQSRVLILGSFPSVKSREAQFFYGHPQNRFWRVLAAVTGAPLPVTVEDIAYHTAAVRRGAPNCLLLADLPFMAYATPEQAFENAATVMRAGANMVKIEGGEWLVETVKMLTERAVPVCGHLGLTPQSVNIFGGYKVQGRGDEASDRLLSDALALEAAGAQLLVLECVPVELAKRITEALAIPVIGIGAGNVTDGQILVMHDAFGITGGHIPKFAKNFLAETGDIRAAVRQYMAEVESGVYPGEEHSFH